MGETPLNSFFSFSFYGLCASALLTVTLMSGSAHAGPAQDAAFDDRGSFVRDSWGKCVRTKWDGDEDPCNPTPPPPPPPAPEPVAAPAPAPEPVVELEQRTIYFDFDSAKIDSEGVYKLNLLAQLVNESKQISDVRVVGYADQFGTSDYNVKLSERRVQTVKSYLDERSRLSATAADIKGLGKAPAEAECAAIAARKEKIACMRKERRVEIEFKYIK